MPGSGKQPTEIQEQIKELLEAGFDPTTIHRRLKVGRSSIYRMRRCLQQHGTNYMPSALAKKNGRPKALTPDQEIEVKEWLQDPKNRNRYLDDLVWLIHDRFGIVCSTTTMSKLKRKWLRVIEYEETGTPIDDLTRSQLMETHPDLPLLPEPQAPPAQMSNTNDSASPEAEVAPDVTAQEIPSASSHEQATAGSQQSPIHPQQQHFSPTLQQTSSQHQQFLPTQQHIPQQQIPPPAQQYSPLQQFSAIHQQQLSSSHQAFLQSPTMQMQMQAQMMVGATQFPMDPNQLPHEFQGDFTGDMTAQHLSA